MPVRPNAKPRSGLILGLFQFPEAKSFCISDVDVPG